MKFAFLLTITILPLLCFSQIDTAFISKLKSLDTANILMIDTSDVPNDGITNKIRQLRKEKTGLSLETLMYIKITEEQQKDTKRPREFYDRLRTEISSGHTSKLLDNCFVNIYRRTFTEAEIDAYCTFIKPQQARNSKESSYPCWLNRPKRLNNFYSLRQKELNSTKDDTPILPPTNTMSMNMNIG